MKGIIRKVRVLTQRYYRQSAWWTYAAVVAAILLLIWTGRASAWGLLAFITHGFANITLIFAAFGAVLAAAMIYLRRPK